MKSNTHKSLRFLSRLVSVITLMVIMTSAGAQNRVTLETAAGTTRPNDKMVKFIQQNEHTLLVQTYVANPGDEELYRAVKNAAILDNPELQQNYSASLLAEMNQFVEMINNRLLRLEPFFKQEISYSDAMRQLMNSPTD